MSSGPKLECWIASIRPSTSTIATGSLRPDSASRTRASRRSMLDPRRTEKTAAPSVAATIEPSSRPSSVLRSSSTAAIRPTIAAVPTVPTTASERLGQRTGRISSQPAASPPSNRIRASAITPIRRASSTSWSEWPKSTSDRPSEPRTIPRPRKSTRPGTRSWPATSVAPIPRASSPPASRISVPSLMRARLPRHVRERPERVPLEVGFVRPRPLLALAVDPGRAEADLLGRADVVLEAEGDVQDLAGVAAEPAVGELERRQRRLVRVGVLGHDHLVELHLELTQRVLDDGAVGVRDDRQPQPRLLGAPQRGHGVGERLPAAHRLDQGVAVLLVPAVAALARPLVEAVAEHVRVALVVALDALELQLLPALAERTARAGVVVAVAPSELVQEPAEPALPVDQGPVAVECRRRYRDPVPLLHLNHVGAGTGAG